jgi:DNA replication protein DnaC
MELVNAKPPRAIGTLARPTKDVPANTLALEKLSEFQTLGEPQLKRMKLETARFITEYKRGYRPRWLSLLGTSGAGKTMLAKEIRRICGGPFVTWTRVTNMLREGEYRWFSDLMHEHIVILDDIGSEYETPFVAAKLYEFLSERVGRWTVITANLSLEDIGNRLDTRIASRMLRDNSRIVDVDVPDFNLREKEGPS